MIRQKPTLAFLMVTLCALVFSSCEGVVLAQDQGNPTISVKEKLQNGEYIVAVDGVEQRTLTAEHAREILKTSEDLDRAQRARIALEKQIAIYEDNLQALKEVVTVADGQRKEEAGLKENFKALYEGEHALRLDAEKLHSPGTVDRMFANAAVQLVTKIGVPAFQSWLTTRNRNTTVVMTGDQLALLQSQQWLRPMYVPRQ